MTIDLTDNGKEVTASYYNATRRVKCSVRKVDTVIGMNPRINYDDNIFLLQTMVKTLRSALTLDVDPEMFKDKILEDIFFIDSTFMKIFSQLRDNPNLIRRAEYLKALLRAETSFLELLNDTISAQRPLAESLSPFSHKLRASRDSHANTVSEIQGILRDPEEQSLEEDVVSQQELNFLLQEQGDDSDESGEDR
ncbi:MAG: hypothetical protein ACQETQ_07125 [Spirochaetota bacterium]